MTTSNDPRRYRVIEVRRRTASCYHLTINSQLWSEVEWSPARRAWCIQDAAGRCLTHVEHIHAQHADADAAIQLAKRMIRDGRMPAPEEAEAVLQERRRRDRLGEPWELLQDRAGADLAPAARRLNRDDLK